MKITSALVWYLTVMVSNHLGDQRREATTNQVTRNHQIPNITVIRETYHQSPTYQIFSYAKTSKTLSNVMETNKKSTNILSGLFTRQISNTPASQRSSNPFPGLETSQQLTSQSPRSPTTKLVASQGIMPISNGSMLSHRFKSPSNQPVTSLSSRILTNKLLASLFFISPSNHPVTNKISKNPINQLVTSQSSKKQTNQLITSQSCRKEINILVTSQSPKKQNKQLVTSQGSRKQTNKLVTSQSSIKQTNQLVTSQSLRRQTNQLVTSQSYRKENNQLVTSHTISVSKMLWSIRPAFTKSKQRGEQLSWISLYN